MNNMNQVHIFASTNKINDNKYKTFIHENSD